MSRKSLASIVLDAQVFGENDDEAERLILRHKSKENTSLTNVASPNRRQSLGLSLLKKIPEPKMREHISHCIKLYTENKINIKNAFGLEMIDFMAFMVSKKQSDNADMQVVSSELDVCTKIYSYRVDSLYTNVLKMAGGLSKDEKNIENDSNEEKICESAEVQLQNQVKKRKKNKQKIFCTESELKGSIEVSCSSKSIIGSQDTCTSDMLYQATLPIHANCGFYYHQYHDIILDVVDDKIAHEENSSEYTIPALQDCTNLDVCAPFSDFKFLNQSCEDEPVDGELNQQDNQNNFQFDLDANISSEGEVESELLNHLDIQEDEDNVNQCMRNQEQVENIVDFRNIVAMQVPELDKPSEYSFIQKHCVHWAGPSYWKIKTFGKSLSNSKVVETCHQARHEKKKALVIEYNDNIKSAVKQGFVLEQAAKKYYKKTPKSWKGTQKTLPEDLHYNNSQLDTLYMHSSIIPSHDQNKDQLNASELSIDENYNYNNENDVLDYCANTSTHNDEVQEQNDPGDKDTAVKSVAFIGDNLIAAPKLTQKIVVPYAAHAKKIDMRQLKQSIWKILTSSSNEENDNTEKAKGENANKVVESKPFNMVYKSLPTLLSKTNTEALSAPVAFVSLLHLANEKSLSLSSVPDLSDVIINEM